MPNAIVYLRLLAGYPEIAVQKDACLEWAEENEYDISEICFDDENARNDINIRPGIASTFNLLKRSYVLVVYSVNLITSSLTEKYKIIDLLRQKKCVLHSITDTFDDPEDPLESSFREVLAANAIALRKQHGANMKKLLAEKKAQGTHIGRPIFGKKSVNGMLVDDPEEQKVIALMMSIRNTRDERGNKNTIQFVTDFLNQEHIPRGRNAKAWYKSTVGIIISREEKDPVMKEQSNLIYQKYVKVNPQVEEMLQETIDAMDRKPVTAKKKILPENPALRERINQYRESISQVKETEEDEPGTVRLNKRRVQQRTKRELGTKDLNVASQMKMDPTSDKPVKLHSRGASTKSVLFQETPTFQPPSPPSPPSGVSDGSFEEENRKEEEEIQRLMIALAAKKAEKAEKDAKAKEAREAEAKAKEAKEAAARAKRAQLEELKRQLEEELKDLDEE